MTADEVIDGVGELPSDPSVVARLLPLLDDPLQNNSEIIKTLKYDPVITLKLMRRSNSAAIAGGPPISSISEAVMRLGHQERLQQVVGLCFGKSLSTELKGYAVEAKGLWHHSVIAAMAAEQLVQVCQAELPPSESAFTAGLLHDIGKTILNHALEPEIQDQVRARVTENNVPLVEAERAVIGVDHAQVGGRLIARWNLPEWLVEAVSNHHAPPIEDGVHLSAIVHLANACAHLVGASYGWNSFASRMQKDVPETLGINLEDMERIMMNLQDQAEKVKAFLSSI